MTVAEEARRCKCSETSVAKWRDQFVGAGVAALEAAPARGPSAREAQLERELAEVTSALGEADVRLRLAERDGAAGFGFEELEVIRLKAGLSVARFGALVGIAESRPAARRMRRPR